eukprot:CAMPEP_0178901966 /NCGR_PEP_ID=MMETSP0786-20121207/4337_1 /TAXON_ID=186022 /ORGANISM="Thalassionema frauenfeldii, Strain CCMP 1798" /LENGTH=218 /DNA_ID=CAMNT_0020573169 /DNA_START=242 /DNA_END=898 /DNA_ORIENTATION=-
MRMSLEDTPSNKRRVDPIVSSIRRESKASKNINFDDLMKDARKIYNVKKFQAMSRVAKEQQSLDDLICEHEDPQCLLQAIKDALSNSIRSLANEENDGDGKSNGYTYQSISKNNLLPPRQDGELVMGPALLKRMVTFSKRGGNMFEDMDEQQRINKRLLELAEQNAKFWDESNEKRNIEEIPSSDNSCDGNKKYGKRESSRRWPKKLTGFMSRFKRMK